MKGTLRKMAIMAVTATLLFGSGCEEYRHPTCTIDPADFLSIGIRPEREALVAQLLEKGYTFRKDPLSLRFSLKRDLLARKGTGDLVRIEVQVHQPFAIEDGEAGTTPVLSKQLERAVSSVAEYHAFMGETLLKISGEIPKCKISPLTPSGF